QLAGPLDDVEMPVGHRIEGAGIEPHMSAHAHPPCCGQARFVMRGPAAQADLGRQVRWMPPTPTPSLPGGGNDGAASPVPEGREAVVRVPSPLRGFGGACAATARSSGARRDAEGLARQGTGWGWATSL